jgi:hypothetical protein
MEYAGWLYLSHEGMHPEDTAVQIRIIEFGWYIICKKSIFKADGHKERKDKHHLHKSG